MAAHRGHKGPCKICAHAERVKIELLVVGGASQTAVAKKYGVSKDSVHRHYHAHISDTRRVSLTIGPVARQALASRVAEESESVLDHFKAIRSGLYDLFSAAHEAGDRVTGAMLSGRLHENLNSMARLTGQLASSPLIQNNQINFFLNDPAFAQFQADLIRVLSKFPAAREAIVAEFERLETSMESQVKASLPALEHFPNNETATEAA